MLKSYKLLGNVGTNKINAHPRNKTKFVAIAISIMVLLAVVIILGMGGSTFNLPPQKIDVSNVQIVSGAQPGAIFNFGGTPTPVVSYSIKNLYNVDITSVGLSVDKTNYGQSTVLIPAGRTVSTSTTLDNEIYSASRTYAIKFTFTFADGTHETYSTSYKTPVGGQAQIASISLTVAETQGLLGSTYSCSLQVDVQNTGELPIIYAQGTYANGDLIFFSSYARPLEIMKGTGSRSYASQGYIDVGMSISVTIKLTYSDGNTQTIQTSVVAKSK